MNRILSLLFLLFSATLFSQLQSPSDYLGYKIGTQFTRHAEVIDYFEYVAANTNLVTYRTYGKTNERRTLTYAVVSSKENLDNLESIRTQNLQNTGLLDGAANPETAIVWLSYNVHGNESSGTEAAMQTIYELITNHSHYLENTIVIIDPCVNPDGRDRYVNWYNQVKASPYDVSQVATEHNEPWPGGRPNHYLFDLNRDWMWATQVESQQRLKIYNQWMPHIHVDFHEQGINEPYYFAPAAAPFHEIISDWQREFQVTIGKNHAKYFDQKGWLFFTREQFDLLYPSYGDTYPTFMGAIGMTYEQAGHGRAGLAINTDEGYVLTLVDRIKHHTKTGISTVEISSQNAKRLNDEFKSYFNNDDLQYKSYVLNGNADNKKDLTNLLDLHEIKWGYSNSSTASGYHYALQKKGTINAENAIVINTDQPKGKMVKALFEPNTKLNNPITYDITSWSLPYAYGLDAIASTQLLPANDVTIQIAIHNNPSPKSPGYISKWNSLRDASFLAALLKANIKVRFTEKKVSFNNIPFERGSLIITRSDNKNNPKFDQIVTDLANEHQRELFASTTSFSDTGTDFGSPNVKLIHKQRIAILKGNGVDYQNYGALWHFFETRLQYPITSIDLSDFSNSTLDGFDVLLLPEMYYWDDLDEMETNALTRWIRKGGKVMAIGRSVGLFSDKDGFGISYNEEEDTAEDNIDTKLLPYDQRTQTYLDNVINGSIYKISLDTSHPLAFGYDDEYYSLKTSSRSFSLLADGYNVGYIKGEPISVAGYSGEKAKKSLQNSMILAEKRMGFGNVIYVTDDIMYYSFWENGKLLLVNGIFFVTNN